MMRLGSGDDNMGMSGVVASTEGISIVVVEGGALVVGGWCPREVVSRV